MALFESLRRSFRTPQVRYTFGGDAGVAVANMGAAQLYRTQPNLRAVVSFLADNAAQVPLKVHDRAGDNDRPRVTDSPAALLLAQPNPDMTPFELKRWMYSDLLLYERFLALLVPSADTESGWELRPVPSSWVVEYRGRSPFAPESVVVGVPGGAPVEVPADRFVLFHGYDPNDPMRQCSRIAALKETLHEQVESNSFRRQMWQRGGRFNMYLTRPKDVERWTPDAFERFKETWKASWAGSEAGEGGGTPILEDGMEIRNVAFNSRDAQWAESVRLSREDCAAVFHVNPALIWPGNGQTYASAKDNARALYNDALAPLLMQATDRISMDVLPRVGEPRGHYVVYDITIKTQGSFEERVAAGQTACGVPFMTINEVRAANDLPAIEGGDEIVQPLNMLYGGLASVRDTDPTRERYNAAPVAHVDEHGDVYAAKAASEEAVDTPKAPAGEPASRKAKGDPAEGDADELAEVYRAFFERQAKSVLPKIEGKAGTAKDDGAPAWWNAERWDSELADDLYPVAIRQADAAGRRAVAALWPDDPTREYGSKQTAKYIRRMCEARARMVNAVTLRELQAALETDGKAAHPDGEKGLLSTARGVFQFASEHRALTAGLALATALAGFAVHEACKQNRRRGENVYKTWRTKSGNPRSAHKALDGETVQMDEPFSNGMDWPGDMRNGDASQVANCKCVLDVEVRAKETEAQRYQRRIDEAEVIHPEFYAMTVVEVAAERERYDAEFHAKWNDYKSESKRDGVSPKEAYDKTVGKHFSSLSKSGNMKVDTFVELKNNKGHEAQLSKWFADSGHAVRLRTSPSVGDTNDALIDGIAWEFKRISSDKVAKLNRRVTEKIPRQGPRFVVDLSESAMSEDVAEAAVVKLLDDENITEIMLVQSGRVKHFKK